MTVNMKKRRPGDRTRAIDKSRKTLSLENELISEIHVLRKQLGIDFTSACKLMFRDYLTKHGAVIQEGNENPHRNIPKKYLE